MNVLVDTSVWVAHFKQRNQHLVGLLDAGRVVCHPYVIVEVACGTPPNRQLVLTLLEELEFAPVATVLELLGLIERRALSARGCGCVDISLLASALLDEHTQVWTLDKRLSAMAADLGLAYSPTVLS